MFLYQLLMTHSTIGLPVREQNILQEIMLICGTCFCESFNGNFLAYEKSERLFSVWKKLPAITICIRSEAELHTMSPVSCLSKLTSRKPKENRMLISCTNQTPKLKKKHFNLSKNKTLSSDWNTSQLSEVDKGEFLSLKSDKCRFIFSL